ncbi:MAG: helix-turn-helix domain-containing protein [Actinomycetia bacterium]|nr:helix-turn-helix domain-containing protein [Actinomycetes bacterium]
MVRILCWHPMGQAIRAARHDRGWTLEELARRIPISASQLARIERGRHPVDWRLAVAVARALQDPRITRLAVALVRETIEGVGDDAA